MNCPSCAKEVMDIDVRCMHCGTPLGATGAHRMLGQVVLGVYELVDVLGQGGMSVVFKGKHKMTEQEVALKILPPELAAHSQLKSRFLEEARALAALDHPNIVHLYNFGQENGFFVLAMQMIQGKTWERLILESKRLDWKASCKIACDVLRALEYAHGRGVVHRDMKPSNVLVREHDGMATVMDFGIAKMTNSTRLTATGQTMGTVRYMSPEQVRGHEVDSRTDIYSLGATLYESLTGDTPFDGSTHFEIMTKHLSEAPKAVASLGIDVPKLVDDALLRSLAKKTADRFQDAREMRKLLEAALRAADPGLVDTHDVGSVVSEVRAAVKDRTPVPTTPPPGATATAAPEAPTVGQRVAPTKRRSVLPWVALGVLVVGAGTTAVVMKTTGSSAAAAGSASDIPGFTPKLRERFGRLRVESAGSVSPGELAEHYRKALDAMRSRMAAAKLDLVDPVDVIVAVSQPTMCDTRIYYGRKMRYDCTTVPAFAVVVPNTGQRRLMVVDDPARLAAAFELGVADAVCAFDVDDAKCEIARQLMPKVPE